MKRLARFSWCPVFTVTLIVCLKMNSDQSAFAGETGKNPIERQQDFFKTWATYDELTKWVKEQDPERHPAAEPLIHYQGRQSEMAVWFYQWPTGVRRTHFTVYRRTDANGPWRVLLVHNVVEDEQLITEKRSDGLAIKAKKSRKTILILPD